MTILPIFFDSVASCTADSVSSMSTWGYATSIAMAIVALAMAAMLFHPRMRRLKTLGKGVLVLSASYAVTVLWSALIWIKELAPLKTMTRGFFFPFYQVIGIFAAAATLYLFGKNGIWYCLPILQAAASGAWKS